MEGLVRFYQARAKLVVILAAVLTVVAGFIASHLTLDPDLERLLPETAPSVRGLEQLEESYGIIGRVNVVLQGDPEKLHQAVDELAPALAELEGVERIDHHRPVDFFNDKRLLYIEKDDLAEASKRIKKRLKWEKRRANPLFVDVGGGKPPEVDLSDIEQKYEEFKQDEYYCSEDGKMCVVFLFPNFSAGDLAASRALLSTVRSTVESQLGGELDGVTFGISGRYQKRIDQQDALNQDLRAATTIALVLLFIFLVVYFRGVLAAVWVFVPLIMGTIWAFAWAEIVFGSLNVLTGFFGAVLLGLGIDYGIHILSRFLEALEQEDPPAAMLTTLASAGRASIFAGLTTVIAFGSLMASSFRAFFEYGVIALGGMALLIVANITVLPCILLLIANTRLQPRSTMSVHLASHLGANPERSWKTYRALLVGLLVTMTLAAAAGLPNTAFEYDFRNVQTTDLESWRLDEHVDRILGTSQLPVVVLTEDDEHARVVAEEMRRRTTQMPEGAVMGDTLTLQDVLPKEQTAKLEILQDLDEEFEKLPDRVIKDEIADFYEEIQKVLKDGAVEGSHLPHSIRAPFQRVDDPAKTVVIGLPKTKQHDVKEMEQLAVIIRGLPAKGDGTVDGINDSLLLVDIFASVKRDSVVMVGITVIGLLLTALLAFRDPRRVALLLGTIGTAVFMAVGAVGWWHIKFNFINMVVVPIWLGLGVDAAFHLMIRHEESPGEVDGFIATALAVGAAFFTSMIGFGAMLVTSHKGLSSMGAIAVVGLASILATSFVIQALVLIGHRART